MCPLIPPYTSDIWLCLSHDKCYNNYSLRLGDSHQMCFCDAIPASSQALTPCVCGCVAALFSPAEELFSRYTISTKGQVTLGIHVSHGQLRPVSCSAFLIRCFSTTEGPCFANSSNALGRQRQLTLRSTSLCACSLCITLCIYTSKASTTSLSAFCSAFLPALGHLWAICLGYVQQQP